jgi:hypothetical protein
MAFQVFISYARKDNAPLLGAVVPDGFISRMRKDLVAELTRQGSSVQLWRDTRNIGESDQFEPILEEALDASQALVVVFSANWSESDYCNAELARFAAKRPNAKDRIIVVQLQLARAAKRAADAPFTRLIWAPRMLFSDDGAVAADRDPFAVLARFDQQLATDKVDGSEFGAFVEFVVPLRSLPESTACAWNRAYTAVSAAP